MAPQLRPAPSYLPDAVQAGSTRQEPAAAAAAETPAISPQVAAPAAAQQLAEASLDDGSVRGGGGGGGMQPPALSAQTAEPDVAVQLGKMRTEAATGAAAASVESLVATYADEWRLSLEQQQRQPFQPPPLTALRRPVPVIIDLETTGGWGVLCLRKRVSRG